MANNYTQATVQPELPEEFCGKGRRDVLEAAGFRCVPAGEGLLYFYAEDGINEIHPDAPPDWLQVFQDICKEGKLLDIVVQGCWYCDKLCPGEFGGFVIRITPDGVQADDTNRILEAMRSNTW